MNEKQKFYVPVLTAILFCCVILSIFAVSKLPPNWREFVCRPESCTVQEWLAAMAGWAGLAAAIYGARLVLRQLKEQQRQNAFILGFSPPTIELIRRGSNGAKTLFRLINWHRGTLGIVQVKATSGSRVFYPYRVLRKRDRPDLPKKIDEYYDITQCSEEGTIPYQMRVFGWLNRQEPPPMRDLALSFDPKISEKVDDNIVFKVSFLVIWPTTKVSITLTVEVEAMYLFGPEKSITMIDDDC